MGAADPLPAAAHGHGRPRWKPGLAPIPTGPASPPPWKLPASNSPPRPASAPPTRPSWRRHRPCRPGHAAARPPSPVQRPQGQMRHLPLPQPRRRAPPRSHRHHRDQHHRADPAAARRGRPRRYTPARPRPPQPPTRRQRITAIITSQPPRDWTSLRTRAHAQRPPRHMATQLREWSLLGWFTRTGLGTYRLNTPPDSHPRQPSPTLNYAALHRAATRKRSRRVPADAGK